MKLEVEDHVRFIPSTFRKWYRYDENGIICFSTGWSFFGDFYCHGNSLAMEIIHRLRSGSFLEIVKSMNGNFGIIVIAQDKVQMAADHVRSIPLLYKIEDNLIIISDDIFKIANQDEATDNDSLVEFGTAGYSTGSNTIFKNVKALQGGELLTYDTATNSKQNIRYWSYLCSYDDNGDQSLMLKEFDDILLSAFYRMAESLNGRQVVIPLSSGYDSRMVAATLKRVGYDNVLCFAYGVTNNFEAVVSREVAKRLGYEWFFVEYNKKYLVTLMNSKKFYDCEKSCYNGISMPLRSDWPAIVKIHHDNIVDKNCIFIPGQSGDFVSGGYLKYIFNLDMEYGWSSVVDAIIHKHYLLWGDLLKNGRILKTIRKRIGGIVGYDEPVSLEGKARLFEFWTCHERQMKFTINSMRGYEYYGYEWRLPLWDIDFVNFWKKVPLVEKWNQSLYKTYAVRYDETNVFAAKNTGRNRLNRNIHLSRNQIIREKIQRILKRNKTTNFFLYLYKKIRYFHYEYTNHPVGFQKYFHELGYMFFDIHKKNVDSLLQKKFLMDHLSIDPKGIERRFKDR